MNTLFALIGVAFLLIAAVGTLLNSKAENQGRPRWVIACNGNGAFTFYNGSGDLCGVDYPTRERAEQDMLAAKNAPPFDYEAYKAEQATRLASFKVCQE
jgi:hypothetical protein